MKRKLKRRLIWFAEHGWAKSHAAVGIDAARTVCGILRSTRRILSIEKVKVIVYSFPHCQRCVAGLAKRYGVKNALNTEFIYVDRKRNSCR